MKASNQLFELITSLTVEEEKKFFLNSSLQQGDKNYIKLYHYIKKQGVYDEELVKKYFENELFSKHFASEKNQLLQHIYKALRLNRSEIIDSARIDENIKNIKILFNKSLYKQARKQLSVLKKQANDYELFYSLLEIVEVEKELMDMEAHFGEINYTSITELIEEENTLFSKIENVAAYELQFANLNYLQAKLMIVRNNDDVKVINDVIAKLKQLEKHSKFLSNKAYIIYLFTMGLSHRLVNDMDKVSFYFSELLILMDNKPMLISEMPHYYIVSHGYLIRYCAIKKQYNEGFKLIDRLKSLTLIDMFKATDLQISIFTQSYITEMILYAYIGQHDKAKLIIPYVIKGLKKYESKINDEELVRIYHTICMVYFGVNDFNKALHWLNKILNTNYNGLRQDTMRISKLINLIIHLELGNVSLISYIYKSTFRFFQQQEKRYQFEIVFLNFFKKIVISKKEVITKESFITFKKELQDVFKNKNEKNTLEYFNFYAWLDSKIHNITFAEAIKIRRENV